MTIRKSIIEADVQELEQILKTNIFPEHITLENIEKRPDFENLFKHRQSPKFIAAVLLKEKLKANVLVESEDIKRERFLLKREELSLKKEKLTNQSEQIKNIKKNLERIEQKLDILLSGFLKSDQA